MRATAFVTDVWPEVILEPWQVVALDGISERSARISVRSGHGVGKSAFDAWTILWFASCFYPFKIAITAPSSTQLMDILHPEVGKWLRTMPPVLRDRLILKKDRLELIGHEENAFASFRTARRDKPEALQGFHSDNLLVLIDEASGVDDIIFEVAEGTLSSEGARVVMTSNPTRLSGFFYDSHHAQRKHWQCLHVNCTDSSRVDTSYPVEMAEKYGEHSNFYRVRVLGEFPLEEDDVVIPLSLAEAAKYRDVERITEIMPVWGLDVARYGNCRTVLAKRQANHFLGKKVVRMRDTMEVAGMVMHEYENTESDLVPAKIYVDVIGIGAGVVDRLKELGLPVVGVNVGETPAVPRFANLRAELWWRAREWLEERSSYMNDDELTGELCVVTYGFTSTGKLKIESKEDMIKRSVESPDLADAFVLTFAGADRRKSKHDTYKRSRLGGNRSGTGRGWVS